MTAWTGVVLAPLAAGEDEMQSRISTYLHPIAGRPLVWHTLSALASASPAPARLFLLGSPEIDTASLPSLAIEVARLGEGDIDAALREGGVPSDAGLLLADAAAPLIAPEVDALVAGAEATLLTAPDGRALALWLPAGARAPLRDAASLAALAEAFSAHAHVAAAENSVLVRSRHSLAVAVARIRDRLVRRLMDAGVTVLLPESVLLDVDVRVGRDSVLYPGVMLEGQTTIGEETVIGPGCRIIDSWIGSGVELKGWNFIAQTSVRNRAILEPYVRRGFD